jgi:hypothetical protein
VVVCTAATTANAYISTLTDGGDTFTLLTNTNITTTGFAQALSCAYTVTSGGKTSLALTMAASASVGYGVYEPSRRSGSWALDAQGSAQRSASAPYFTGQSLALTGTNDVCFQGFYNQGGAIGVSQFQVPFSFGAGGGDYILNNQASEGVTLGTYYGSLAGTGGAPTWITNQNFASAVNAVCFQ